MTSVKIKHEARKRASKIQLLLRECLSLDQIMSRNAEATDKICILNTDFTNMQDRNDMQTLMASLKEHNFIQAYCMMAKVSYLILTRTYTTYSTDLTRYIDLHHFKSRFAS